MDPSSDGDIIVGKEINVKIEELLPDLILVSYLHPNNKIFQGILLDSTKRKLPCGVYSYKDHQNTLEDDTKKCINEDKLFSVKQRHTYNTGEYETKPLLKRKSIALKKPKNSRMTVRLRPRQVLCSKCQSICNEKSENIGPVKSSFTSDLNTISRRNLYNINNNNVKDRRSDRETRHSIVSELHSSNVAANTSPPNNAVLIPKLIKLNARDIETATNVNRNQDSNSILENNSSIKIKDKFPIVKLNSSRKGKIPKMTISTSSLPVTNSNSIEKCGIRTRSKGSIEEKVLGLHESLSRKHSVAPKVMSSISYEIDGNDGKEKDEIKYTNSSNNTYLEKTYGTDSAKNLLISEADSIQNSSMDEKHTQINIPKVTFLPICLTSTSDSSDSSQKTEKMNLRKKRSVGSMEDLWDETVFDETKKINEDKNVSVDCTEALEAVTDNEKPKTTPILKISFGPGKGTVLKIPAKSTISENDTNEAEEQNEAPKRDKLLISKAARKALRRARKEAQRKASIGIASSLLMSNKARFSIKSPITLGGMSPARLSGLSPGRFGGVSPGRFGGASPGRFGCTSPGRFGGASPARFGSSLGAILLSPRAGKESILWSQSRRHKHKVKHKKKHKEHKHKSSDENAEPNSFSVDLPSCKEEIEPLTESTNVNLTCSPGPEKTVDSSWKVPIPSDQLPLPPTSPKQSYLLNTRHKLSISIKRVSNASYVACDPSSTNIENSTHLQTCGIDKIRSKDSSDLEDLPTLSPDPDVNESYKPMGLNCNFLNISPERDAGSDHNQSNDENWEVPDFPYVDAKLSWHKSDGWETAAMDIKVGDVVWGQMHDLPWWPAKVISLKISDDIPVCQSERNYYEAEVNWYGTNSSSLLPAYTLKPFLKNFNVIFNKRKRGPYLDAVRQASYDAKQLMENLEQSIANICESPITASPREVDVVS